MEEKSTQFFSFITFRPAKHLDGKHTIFGRLVGGLQTLISIENVPTDKKTDEPLVCLMTRVLVFFYAARKLFLGASRFYARRSLRKSVRRGGGGGRS